MQAHLAGGPGVTAVTAQWSSGIDSPAGVAVAYTVVPSTMQAAADALADDAVASVWRSRIEPLTVITATVTTSETKRILVSRVVTLTDKATTDKLTASYGERPVPQPTGAGSGQ